MSRVLYRPANSPGPVVRCGNCELVHIGLIENDRALISVGPVLGDSDPAVLTSSDLNDIAGSWELDYLPAKLTELPALRLDSEAALGRIARYRQPPGRLLDFGCGWGFFLGAAAEAGWEGFGLEPLPALAVYARSRFRARVVTDIMRDDTFPPDYFDVVTSFQVFEHLPYPLDDLRRVHRSMKPEGLVLIEAPSIDALSVCLLRSRHRHFVPDHLNFFSRRTMRLLVERAGFELVAFYQPARNMTLGHLVSFWGARYLSRSLVFYAERILHSLALYAIVVKMNVYDNVGVIARKPRPLDR